MLYKIRKPFPYAENGHTIVTLAPGSEREFGAEAEGLAAAGLIEFAAGSTAPPETSADPEEIVADEPEIEFVPEVTAEPAEPEVTPEPPTIAEPAPEPVRQPRKRK